jgi:hypothetical protein
VEFLIFGKVRRTDVGRGRKKLPMEVLEFFRALACPRINRWRPPRGMGRAG